MEEIFVPYEIAIKLEEIGFDEPCVGFYADRNEDGDLFDGWKIVMEIDTLSYGASINLTDDFQLFDYNDVGWISAPTWEQVFKWFREKGYKNKIIPNLSESYNVGVRDLNLVWVYLKNINTYEEAQENLVLKMIEIYKKWKSKKN